MYKTNERKEYWMSASGWYYYDESIADEVNDQFTPKLYILNSVRSAEDYWFVVAFNERHLKESFIESMRFDDMTDEEFWEKYEYNILDNVDGFDIVLK